MPNELNRYRGSFNLGFEFRRMMYWKTRFDWSIFKGEDKETHCSFNQKVVDKLEEVSGTSSAMRDRLAPTTYQQWVNTSSWWVQVAYFCSHVADQAQQYRARTYDGRGIHSKSVRYYSRSCNEGYRIAVDEENHCRCEISWSPGEYTGRLTPADERKPAPVSYILHATSYT